MIDFCCRNLQQKNMKSSLVDILVKFGLSKKEALVYLASIEAGVSPVSKIAVIAGINRVTTYDILDKLKKRGLVSFFTKNKVKYFTGTKPEIVIDQFEKRARDLKDSLPRFQEFTADIDTPKVRYFEGIEGIQIIYAEALTSSTEILEYTNHSVIRKVWMDYDKDYVKKRAKKNLYARCVSVDQRKAEIVREYDSKYYCETRVMTDDVKTFANVLIIFDNKYAVMSFDPEPYGLIIEGVELANSQRVIFEMAWNFLDMGGFDDPEMMKRKMFSPLSGMELHRSIKDMAKPLTNDKKEIKEDNLSLF